MTKKEKIEAQKAQTAQEAQKSQTEAQTAQTAQTEPQTEPQTEWPQEEDWPAQTEAQTEAQTDDTDLLAEPVKHFDILASEKLNNLTNSISLLKEVQKRSDYGIAYALNLINKHHREEIKDLGYKNVEEYAFSKFNYSKSTFHNYVKIAERFIRPKVEMRKALGSDTFEVSTIMGADSFSVLEDVDGYPFTISQLLEMLPLSDEQIQKHLEEFSAGDTTKSIRNKVNAIRSGIETTASETTPEDTPEGTPEGTPEDTGATPGTIPGGTIPGGTTSQPSDDTSRILTILEIVNKLENEEIRNKLVEAINSVINA